MEATENRANIPVSYFIYTSTSQNFTPHRCLPSLLSFILGLTTLSGGGGRKKKKQKSQCSSWSARLSRLARGTEGTSWQSASAHFLITLEPQGGSWGGWGGGEEEGDWEKRKCGVSTCGVHIAAHTCFSFKESGATTAGEGVLLLQDDLYIDS